ncbi:MAG: hypothetical protein CML29_18320 [Rhizobiales bacterium]|nr:hypothetical protein [Hyphomicrobiales bacterium]MBA69859.1 hypothetical protein [Hyphomicrobiales bacterium]
MADRGNSYLLQHGTGGPADAELVDLSEHRKRQKVQIVTFHRRELDLILSLYGRKVADGEWRDYAIDHLKDRAIFSVFRRTSEVALFQIVKDPARARKQGAFSVVAASGAILKRGHELQQVLKVFDKPTPRIV